MPIVSDNRSFRDLVVSGTDRDFGEQIRHVRQAGANQYLPATGGTQNEFTAVVRFGGSSEDLGGTGSRRFASHVSASEGRVMVDPSRFPAAHDIATDDAITLLERPGAPIYRVGRIDPVSSSRLTIHLVK